jgi:hypothetical protein
MVVINEFAYDDTGTDSLEFVELYNISPIPVDISNWTVEGIDLAPTPDSIAVIPPGTILAPFGYYTLGMAAVVPKDQDITANPDFQNDMEAIALKNASSIIIDSVVYERNKANIIIPAGYGEPPFDGISPTSGGGIWSNGFLIESGSVDLAGFDFDGSPNASYSWARHSDGQDTGNNELDFGTQIATPDAANNGYGTINVAVLPYVNNFDVAENTLLTDFPGNYVTAEAQDPTIADVIGAGAKNPSAMVASPQGGNCMIFWDSSGGGDVGIFNLTQPLQNFEIECYIYLPAALTGADLEEGTLIVVRGHADQLYNTGAANGDVGIRWRYTNDSTNGVQLFLEERKDGVSTQIGGTINVIGPLWSRLFLQVNGSKVFGIVGGTYGNYSDGAQIIGTASIIQYGGIGMGYRETVTTNTNCRPNTYDALAIRTPTAISDWILY